MSVKDIAQHMKNNLLIYVILSVITGLIVGEFLPKEVFSSSVVKNSIVLLAIITVLPSMIQLNLINLKYATRRWRSAVIASILIFLIGPLTSYLLAYLIPDKEVGLGFILSNVVPASSASMGYVLIGGGDIELALVIALISIIGSFISTPTYVRLYASTIAVSVPLVKVMYAMIITLLAPLIIGQLIRYYLIRKLGSKFNRIVKPYLSIITMTSMLLLITLLIASRAKIVVTEPSLATSIILMQTVNMTIVTIFSLILSSLIRLSYSESISIVFLSALKNQSVAAAIAVTALCIKSGIVPALIPVIQAPLAVTYLHLIPKFRYLLNNVAK